MSWFTQIMSSDVVYRVGWAIIHSAWQGLAVAAVFGLSLIVIPKRMNNLRYGCGCLALLAMLAMFCATAWIAGPRPDDPSTANPWRTHTSSPPASPPAEHETATTPAHAPAMDSAPPAEPAPAPDAPRTLPHDQPWTHRFAKAVSPWTDYVCGAWFIGVFAMSVWNLGGWIAVRRLRMIGTWPPPERLVAVLNELGRRFSIRRAVKLLQSTVVKVPMTIGWLKPVVLIPASILTELSTQQIEAIIAHELAHVRRCDYLINLVQTVVETLFFHHPAVWWISHRVRLEREYCCDNAVVRLTSDQVNYAKALTELAERKDALPQLAVAADAGSLVGRIRRILGLERESSLLRNRSAGWAIVALILIAAAFAVGIGLNSESLWAAPYKYGATADDGTYATLQKMIGTWCVNAEKSTGAGNVRRIEIRPDATCIRHESAEDDPNPKTFYDHIRLKDGGLVVSGYWGKQAFALALDGDTMIWTESDTRFVFERVSGIPPVPEALTPIVGTWETIGASSAVTLTFKPDGTYVAWTKDDDGADQTRSGFYTYKDGRVYPKDADDAMITVEGDRLTVVDGGITVIYQRKPTFPATGAAAFMGTWELVEGTGPGAGQIRDTWTFEPDGTFVGSDSTESTGEYPRGKWEFKDGRMIVNGVEEIDLQIENGQLIVTGARINKPAVFRKKASPAEITADSLVGTWETSEIGGGGSEGVVAVTCTFDPSGRWVAKIIGTGGEEDIVKEEGDYTLESGRIEVFGPKDDFRVRGRIEGDRLVFEMGDLKLILHKAPSPAVRQALLIGDWNMTRLHGPADARVAAAAWRFKADGTCSLEGVLKDGQKEVHTASYTLRGDVIEMSERMADVVRLIGNRIVVLADSTTTVFEKGASAAPLIKATTSEATRVSEARDAHIAPTTPQAPWVGTWRSEKAWRGGVEAEVTVILDLNADGTFAIVITGEDGTTDGGRYTVKGNSVRFEGKEIDASAVGILEGDTLTISGAGDKVVLKKYEPRLAPYLGVWFDPTDDGASVGVIDALGMLWDITPAGGRLSGRIVRYENSQAVFSDNEREWLMSLTGDVIRCTLIDPAAHPESPTEYTLKRIVVDNRFVGSWKASQFDGAIGKEITTLYLTLQKDAIFFLLGEGGDTGEPIKGFWRTEGDILTLRGYMQQDQSALKELVKSARYDGGAIRIAIGAGAAVLEQVVLNPFAGSDHPKFRAELTSSQSATGQTWLDLDTGRIVGRNEYAAAEPKNAYELTLLGNWQLALHSTTAHMLPLPDVGMDFARAGAAALKYLSSLRQSKLTHCNYKEGLLVAVLTDQGKLAVVELTSTGSNQTPVAWSLADVPAPDEGRQPDLSTLRTIPDTTAVDTSANTLHNAARRGDIEAAKTLLAKGADINAREWAGSVEPPLILAAQAGHHRMVAFLIEQGAKIDEQGEAWYTALGAAVYMGHKKIAVMLLDHGAKIEPFGESKSSALNFAAQKGNIELARILLDRGANINHRGINDATPLYDAAAAGYRDMVALLLSRGADPNVQADYGCTPLFNAYRNNDVDTARILLEHGADPVLECNGQRVSQEFLRKAAQAAPQSPRRVTIPDADTKGIPVVLDLAGGEMLTVPELPEDNATDHHGILNYFTKLGKGDLLYDRVLAVLRGGSVQQWAGGQWAPLAPADRQTDATAYTLPSIPCRLLVTNGNGRKFEVTVLSTTSDGGIEIEYTPLSAEAVTVPSGYEHFIGTYSASVEGHGRTEVFEIVKQGETFLFGKIGRTMKPMLITAEGLAAEDPAERFIFKFDPQSRTYTMDVRLKKDNTLEGTLVLTKTSGPNAQPASTGRAGEYIVQPRDYLQGICLKLFGPFDGVRAETIDALLKLNGLQSGNELRVGQVLKVPEIGPTPFIDLPPRGPNAALSAVDRAKAAELITLLKLTESGIKAYELDTGKWPDLSGGWTPLTEKAGKGPYLKAAPVNPFTGGANIAADASSDWQYDVATGTLKAVVPFNTEKARQLGFDVQKDVVIRDQSSADAEQRIERISFAKGLSIREALQLLGKAFKKNIVPSDGVQGNVPVTDLWDATFEEALRAILGVHKYVIDGSFIRVYTAEEYKAKVAGAVPAGEKMQLPAGASRRVRYALDKIAFLMRYVESQKDGDIGALSGYFDQINEFCDDLQGKNGPAPGRDEWGGLGDAQIAAVLKLLGELEETAEGCRALAQAGEREFLAQHWQTLREQYARLCTALTASAPAAGAHDHFVGWYALTKDIVFPVLKIDGKFYSVCRGMEVPFKETADGLEWALEPSSMVGTTIGRFPGTNQYYLKNMDRQSIHHLEESGANPLGFGKQEPVTRIDKPAGLLNAAAPPPKTLDDFLGYYQPAWFPVCRFHLRKDGDTYLWDEQHADQAGGWENPTGTEELTPLTNGLGFAGDGDGDVEYRLTYNESLERFELVKPTSEVQVRMPMSRLPQPTAEADAKVTSPAITIGIPAWH